MVRGTGSWLERLRAVKRGLGRLVRAALGEVQWRAPPWMMRLDRAARGAGAAAALLGRAHPRSSLAAAVTALALIGAGYVGWRWLESRPRPPALSLTVSTPRATCYACEPAGKPNALIVRFSGPAAALALVGKDLDPASEAVRMTPAIRGTWHWEDDRLLRFVPAEDWPVGAHFVVRLARRDLLAPQVRLQERSFEFTSPRFEARLAATEFHQDPVVASDKNVVVTVAFSHPVEPAELEKRVALTLFEKVTDTQERESGKVPFTVVYDKLRMNAYIHSSRLEVPSKMGRLAIRVARGLRAARGGNATDTEMTANVAVPGLHSLQVTRLALEVVKNERDEPSQALIVEMNHSIVERDMPPSVHAWLLPEKNPDANLQREFERRHPRTPYDWPGEQVTAGILAAAAPLRLTQIPGELEHYEQHGFRHDAPPGRYVFVKVDRGLKSFGGYVLGASAERLFRVPEYPREVRIAQQGSLLALAGERTLTVMSRGAPALHVEIGRLLPRRIQYLVTQSAPTFASPAFTGGQFDAADITERFSSTVRIPASKPGAAHYQSIPMASYLSSDGDDRRGIFIVKVEAWDVEHDRPMESSDDESDQPLGGSSLADQRLVVVTDLGLIEKKSLDGSRDVFVQSIHSGEPLAGVHIEILGRNGVAVVSAVSDEDGHVHFADLRSFKREQEPVLYLARRGGDNSFLPLAQRDRQLDLSRFDVGGVDNRVDAGALSAYLFSDRGLYRPGEAIRIGAIVRSQDWKRSLEGVPLRLDVTDPRGVQVRTEPFTPGAAGFAEIRHATRATSPAGTYTFSLSLVRPDRGGDRIGSTTIQVRDFLPDRLRMSTHFSSEIAEGWVSPQGLSAAISLKNLFGTPAAGRRVTAHMTLAPAFPAFKAYPDFRFFDPQSTRESFEDSLAAQTTSDAGEASFDLGLQRFARATYRVHLTAEGFEADGGRGVGAEAIQLVSSMPFLIGWKPDGPLDFVPRDSHHSVRVIAVDPRLQPAGVAGLRLSRLEVRHVSTLIRQNNGTYQYESRRKEVTLDVRELSLPKEGFELPLSTETPGAFAYVLADADGQRLARVEYHVSGDANLSRTLEKDAQLQITLARADYAPGEEIEMQIQAPYTGSGLITIERDRVYAWRWFRARTTSSTQRIRLPEGIEGNAYIHVEFVRDPASEDIYASPLSYGVQPFSVNLDARRNAIRLKVPDSVKPGETLAIEYATDHPARIVVFAVDEGILQVAGYRTPDPLAHFFEKRSLGVTTAQILDLILPEFRRGNADGAPGGDREGAIGRHLNPFRRKGEPPVTYWSGILDADISPRRLQYVIPDYFNGALRVIAVAVSDEAVGVRQADTTVRGDFVLSPNAPTTVTPSDEFEVSLGVANNRAGSGPSAHLAVSLTVDPGLQILGARTADLAVPENHEGAAKFRLRARELLGTAALEFAVRSDGVSARRRVDLSVRSATPFMTTLTAGSFKNGRKDVRLERDLRPEHRTLEASLSRVPLAFAHGFVTYLANYPYACTEQIVSQAMPALLLAERPEFGYVHAQPGADLQGVVNELRVRQNEEGAYRLWPGGNQVAEFASLYAQHFLIEAAARGQRVPPGLIEAGNAHLHSLARRDGNNLPEERDSAYAIYLLTRQGQITSGEAAALRKRLTERYRSRWEQDLAAVWLAGALKLMRQDDEAEALIARLRFGLDRPANLYDDAMTRDALLLYVTAKHFPERLTVLAPSVMESLESHVSANEYHSLSAGTTLLALDAFASAVQADAAPDLAIAEIRRDGSVHGLELPAGLMPKVSLGAQAGSVRLRSGGELAAYYLIAQSGFDRPLPIQALSKGFEILHDYTDPEGKPVARVKMGDEIDVHLKFRAVVQPAPSRGRAPAEPRAPIAAALVDLLPGGFDLVVSRLGEAAENQVASVDGADGSRAAFSACAFCRRMSARGLEFAEPGEDRVVFYANLASEVQEVVYRIKATNIGVYVAPPAYGEAMYDRNVQARSAAGRIEIVRP